MRVFLEGFFLQGFPAGVLVGVLAAVLGMLQSRGGD